MQEKKFVIYEEVTIIFADDLLHSGNRSKKQ